VASFPSAVITVGCSKQYVCDANEHATQFVFRCGYKSIVKLLFIPPSRGVGTTPPALADTGLLVRGTKKNIAKAISIRVKRVFFTKHDYRTGPKHFVENVYNIICGQFRKIALKKRIRPYKNVDAESVA
jgi:hypothetical protein